MLFADWAKSRTVADLLPREHLLRLDRRDLERLRPLYFQAVAQADDALRAERRSLGALLGQAAAERLLKTAAELEPDPEMVRASLRTKAVQEMLGSVVYDGIREFMRRVDLIGPIIDKLPIIGGIRRMVLSTIQTELEARVESQIKAFLGGFSSSTVEAAIDYVLAPTHVDDFREMRKAIVRHVLDRPLASFVPAKERAKDLHERIWRSFETLVEDRQRWEGLVNRAADAFGERPVGDLVDLRVAADDPLLALPARILGDFLATEPARAWFHAYVS
ncbi:MAG: hypothetical protein HYV63_33630 [Candidatus Schekmanbacteria bacterium]|nr:hypothetical protein [Candidatus Schekmanbacteria bacterium]